MNKFKFGEKKASALLVTMFVMGIILLMGLSVALVATRERRASIGEGRSNSVYQDAETGVEKVMAAIKEAEAPPADISALDIGDIDWSGNDLKCMGARIEEKTSTKFQAELQDASGSPLNCNNGSIPLTDVKFIKSVGLGSAQERALQAAVSHAPNP